ncbi:hypothetical protein OB955_19335 [Halobacteria archaeon AArc-m2/3/4]|uniref:Hpr(Ser) kinase/phosphatase n=1 Tax=Natronoglomus mannanivorans TaxID=2979990 RepID=A0ABT2QIV6_9EURY|nr:hypothetical protein [Halobacteria archaeon AArc-m2/3/4]
MNYYSAYGLTIESEFDLPELPTDRRTGVAADVVIRRDDVDPVPESVDGVGGRRIHAEPDRCRLSYDSIGTFLVEAGTRVRFDPVAAELVTTKLVRRLFENEIMGVLLHQRGVLVLHASAVSIDGKAAIFLGPRGAGKSTTAAAFHEQGYALLEDDLVAVRTDGESPTVFPGVPQLRLTTDAVEALEVEHTTRPDDDGGSEKRYQYVDEVPDPAPLKGCYLLRDGEPLSLERLAPRDQLFELVSNTYTVGLLSDTEATPTHFQQCSTIVETTPFHVLRRPRDHHQLPSLVELVAEDLHSHSRGSVDT